MYTPSPAYMILWEFQVKGGQENQFERVYGCEGDWAGFFARGDGYLGTELHRDMRKPGRYVTVDFWTSQSAYEAFRERHTQEFRALDLKCAALTEQESPLGVFAPVGHLAKFKSS